MFRALRSEKVSITLYLKYRFAEVAQLVEHRLPKPRVAGSSPVFRSFENQAVTRDVIAFFCAIYIILNKEMRYIFHRLLFGIMVSHREDVYFNCILMN